MSAHSQPDTSFTAVDPNAEHFHGETLMVEAYAAIWILLMGWIFMLWRKQKQLSDRLSDLERTLDRAAAAASASAAKVKAGAS
jgi:CcmD family protein